MLFLSDDTSDWGRCCAIPCSRELRSEADAWEWFATQGRTTAAQCWAWFETGAEVRVRQTRPAGWGTDGRPRFVVEARRAA